MNKLLIICSVAIALTLSLVALSYADDERDAQEFIGKYAKEYNSLKDTNPELAAAFKEEAANAIKEHAIEFKEPYVPEKIIERMNREEKVEMSAAVMDKAKDIKTEQTEKITKIRELPVVAASEAAVAAKVEPKAEPKEEVAPKEEPKQAEPIVKEEPKGEPKEDPKQADPIVKEEPKEQPKEDLGGAPKEESPKEIGGAPAGGGEPKAIGDGALSGGDGGVQQKALVGK